MNKIVMFLLCSTALLAVESTTSSSRIELENGKGFYVEGNFLYWSVDQDSLFFGQGLNYTINKSYDVVLANSEGNLKRTRSGWDPGFRLGLGCNWKYDSWTSDLKWTWFGAKAKNSTDNMTLDLLGHASREVANFAWNATSWWHFKYNTIDLDNGRDSWIGKKFSLRPFCGIRGAFIEQNYQVDYELAHSNPTEIAAGSHPLRSLPSLKSNFNGIGLRLGSDANFFFTPSFSLTANGSGSIIYGRFNCHMKTSYLVGHITHLIADTTDKFWQTTVVPSLGLYLKYGAFFGRNKYFAAGSIGWEQSLWFGLNKMIRYMHKFSEEKVYQMNDNLTLQGLTCSLRLDF